MTSTRNSVRLHRTRGRPEPATFPERFTHLPRKHPAERRQEGAIGLSQLRSTDLTPEHGQLLAQRENLDLLIALGATSKRNQLKAAVAATSRPATPRPAPTDHPRPVTLQR
jgi:hypothetical protein